MKKIFLIATLGVAGLASANGVLTTEKTVRGVEQGKKLEVNSLPNSTFGTPVEVYCYDEQGNRVTCPDKIVIVIKDNDTSTN